MQHLEDELARERSDRIQSLEDQLNPIRKGMAKEFSNLETEKNERVAKEREILQNLHDEGRKIEDSIKTEKEQREEMQKDLVDKLMNELARQKLKIERIKTDTLGEFDKDRRDIGKEMDSDSNTKTELCATFLISSAPSRRHLRPLEAKTRTMEFELHLLYIS